MPNPEWEVTAVADLLAIVDYISDDNPDAAQALKDEVETKAFHLPENPQLYRVGTGRWHPRDGGTYELHRGLR